MTANISGLYDKSARDASPDRTMEFILTNTDRTGPPSTTRSSGTNLSRGRPKSGMAAAISETIIKAAADSFLQFGFEEASMESIAAKARVTKVTLYKRYPDKRSLLRAVLLERRLQWTIPAPTSPDPEVRLKDLATAILVCGTSPQVRVFHDLAAAAWAKPGDMATREEVLGYDTMLLRLEQEIRSGAHELQVEARNAPLVARALMAMLSGWFEHWGGRAETQPDDIVVFAHKAVELIIHGTAAW